MAKPTKTTLTDKHLEYFKERVLFWCYRFGQVGWQLDIEWTKPDDENHEIASCRYNGDNKRASICLSRTWTEPVTNASLNRYAFHEVLHLFFANLVDFANENAPKGVDANRIEHEMIRTLENIILD